MLGTLITWIVIIGLVAGGIYFLRQRRHKAIEAAGSLEIYNARKEVERVERLHATNVRNAEKYLNELRSQYGRKLASFKGITVHEMWISTPHGSGPVAGARASVESQFSQRLTATRMLALGVFSLAAPKRTGEVYLTVEAQTVVSMIKCDKDSDLAARQFAMKINNAGLQAEKIQANRPAQIAAAETTLANAKDRTLIEQAQAHVLALETSLREGAPEAPEQP